MSASGDGPPSVAEAPAEAATGDQATTVRPWHDLHRTPSLLPRPGSGEQGFQEDFKVWDFIVLGVLSQGQDLGIGDRVLQLAVGIRLVGVPYVAPVVPELVLRQRVWLARVLRPLA